MGRARGKGKGKGRGRPRKGNTSKQTADPTTEANPQPIADPDTGNVDATNAGAEPDLPRTPTASQTGQDTKKSTRKSPRLEELRKKEAAEKAAESAQAGDQKNSAADKSTGRFSKKRKEAETGVSLDLAEVKGKASKGKKGDSTSSPTTKGKSKEEAPRSSQLKIGQAVDDQNLGGSSENPDFESLYNAEKKRADELEVENLKLRSKLDVAKGKRKMDEEPAGDTNDAGSDAEDTKADVEDAEVDAEDATDTKQGAPDTDGGHEDSD